MERRKRQKMSIERSRQLYPFREYDVYKLINDKERDFNNLLFMDYKQNIFFHLYHRDNDIYVYSQIKNIIKLA